jgi:hypothetical protein
MDPKEERKWDLWVDRCVESATDLYMGDDEPDEEPPCPKQGPAGIHIPTVYVANQGVSAAASTPIGLPLRGRAKRCALTEQARPH